MASPGSPNRVGPAARAPASETLLAVWLALVAPLAMIFSTQSTAITVPVAAVASAIALAARGASLPDLAAAFSPGRAFLAAFGILCLVAALSLAWTPLPARAATDLAAFVGAALGGFALAMLAPKLLPPRAGDLLAAGVLALAALAFAESQFGSPLRSLVGADPDGAKINRAVAVLALLAFPAAAHLAARGQWLRCAGLAAACAVAALTSYAQGPALGLVLGILGVGLAWALRRHAIVAVAAAAAIAMLATPVLVSRLDAILPSGIETALRSASVRERLIIWRGFAEAVPAAPVVGHGFGATRTMSVVGEIPVPRDTVTTRRAFVPGHAHNAPLQTWVELGALGVAAGLAVLASLLVAISRLPMPVRAFAFGGFVCAMAIACVGFGAWQAWWYGGIGLMAAWFRAIPGRASPSGR